MTCPYEILGVSKYATASEIRSAYHALAKLHHPDQNGGSQESSDRFRPIAEAYAKLRDATKRAAHDREERRRAMAQAQRERESELRQKREAAEAARREREAKRERERAEAQERVQRMVENGRRAREAARQQCRPHATRPPLTPTRVNVAPPAPTPRHAQSTGSSFAALLAGAVATAAVVAAVTSNTRDDNGRFHGRDGRFRSSRWG